MTQVRIHIQGQLITKVCGKQIRSWSVDMIVRLVEIDKDERKGVDS